jgi:hypothetical protein
MLPLSPISIALFIGLATILGSFFVKLYRARMLLVSRRKQGLVRIEQLKLTPET